MKIIIFFLALNCFSPLFSEENNAKNSLALKLSQGEGQFLTREKDDQELIKKVLTFHALKDLITKELKKMGADSNLFWKKFDEKFELMYGTQKKDFLSKKEEAYQDKERDWLLKSFILKSDFLGLQSAINSFTVTRLTRAPQNPLLRYMSIEGDVGLSALGQLFRKVTQDGPVKEFAKVLLFSKFELVNCHWTDLGVDNESDFTKVVKEHWLNWIKGQFKGEIENFQLADEGTLRDIEEEIKEKSEIDAAKKWELLLQNDGGGDYADALLLSIVVRIKKVGENTLNQTRNIEVSSEYIYKAINSNFVLSSGDLNIVKKEYSTKEKESYSSALATSVYQSPLNSWSELKKATQIISPSYRTLKIEIKNSTSLGDLLKIKEMMENLAPGRQVRSEIISQTEEGGLMELKINGNKDDITRFLNSLDNNRIAEGKVLLVKNKSTPYMLELKNSTSGPKP